MLLFVSGWMLWDYHWLLQDALAKGEPAQPFRFGIRACIFNLSLNGIYTVLCTAMFFFGDPCWHQECKPDLFAQYIEQHHTRSFSTMSMNLRRWTTLTRQTHADWATRFNHLWMLPEFFIKGPEFVLHA